ncbi:MAG: zinc-binding dehydrogenase [Candidatus Hydrogenedentes bacterium]|nr:zinc-binding dehydrogenase [Candidatus Hydrogenedentota bacterium]
MPAPAPGEMLVRITACTLCGSDLHTLQGHRTTPTPTILGHEIIGEIAALNSNFEYRDLNGVHLRLGDRVTWAVAASCGTCFYCRAGLPQKCEKLFKYGHESLDRSPQLSGGLAEFCHLAKGSHVLRLPPGLPDEVSCPANCATATVAAAFRAAETCEGQDVLVQGAGLLGLTACAMAKSKGARTIVISDPDENRLNLAKAFGATHCHKPTKTSSNNALLSFANEGRGYDLILEMSGAHAAIELGIELLRMGGRYVWVGPVFPGSPVAVNPERVARHLLTISGIHNYTPQDLVEAVAFLDVNHSHYPFQSLVPNWFRLENFQEALNVALKERPIRVGIRR